MLGCTSWKSNAAEIKGEKRGIVVVFHLNWDFSLPFEYSFFHLFKVIILQLFYWNCVVKYWSADCLLFNMLEVSSEQKVAHVLLAFYQWSPVFYHDISFRKCAAQRNSQEHLIYIKFMKIVLIASESVLPVTNFKDFSIFRFDIELFQEDEETMNC